MKKVARIIDQAVGYAESGVCLATLSVIIVLAVVQIVMRYVLSASLPWAEEIINTLMVMMVMFGAARATRKGRHTEMDGFTLAMPKPLRIGFLTFNTLLTLAFLVIIVVSSAEYTLNAGNQKSFMLRIPMPYMYMWMPVGGLFMVYEFIKTIKSRLMKTQNKEETA